ncbi:hypothetical protein Leryth_022048 [Lithospermum erythrorhizon]|nr:hypothetical protein Leryth_022048 [Lithospermum erythrorhizon]
MSPSHISKVLSAVSLVFIVFLLDANLSHAEWSVGDVENGTLVAESEMVPYIEPGKMVMMMNESRRKLGSFHICSLCTCCGGGTNRYCLPTPCCYAINCNIPNKPFGFCSFTPRTCNCFRCHI